MSEVLADPSRRSWLASSLVLGAGLAAATGAAPGAGKNLLTAADLPDWRDPKINLRDIVRLQGSLIEEDIPWWFTGVIFAVRGKDETPRPLLRFEGMEVYWFAHTRSGYQLGGHTVTFFRDFETGAFLQEFVNPYTGKRVEVKPAVQGGNLGFAYTAEGIWPVRLDGTPFVAPTLSPLQLQWHAVGPQVWLQHQTIYPPGMPAMHGQRQTLFATRRDVTDLAISRLPASFSSVVFMNWFKWLEMSDVPGHLVWHASGVKLASRNELPSEYRERAEREFPERMTAKPAALSKPAASSEPSTG